MSGSTNAPSAKPADAGKAPATPDPNATTGTSSAAVNLTRAKVGLDAAEANAKAADAEKTNQQAASAKSASIAKQNTTSQTGDKVTVACKLPHGLVIQLHKMVEQNTVDGKTFQVAIPVGDKLVLNGSNTSNIIGGFGLTKNVDKEFFQNWLDQNGTYGPVAQGLIFAMDNDADAKAEAKSRSSVKNGLEPVDPLNPGKGLEPVGASGKPTT